MNKIIIYENVDSKIIELRGEQVIVDRDVAELYGVETKRINEAVSNNPDKFPEGYIINADIVEWENLRSKISTTNISSKTRVPPKAFTEKGLYMLATILKSPVATQTTIAIIDAFASLRDLNRAIKQIPESTNENEQLSLATRASNAIMVLLDDELLEKTGGETSMEFNLPFFKVKRTIKLEKRKE
jgi:hypothetical protein